MAAVARLNRAERGSGRKRLVPLSLGNKSIWQVYRNLNPGPAHHPSWPSIPGADTASLSSFASWACAVASVALTHLPVQPVQLPLPC